MFLYLGKEWYLVPGTLVGTLNKLGANDDDKRTERRASAFISYKQVPLLFFLILLPVVVLLFKNYEQIRRASI